MLVGHHDFETRNALDLKKVGLDRYVRHPSMGVWCMSWRLGDAGPVQHWRPGYPDPTPLLDHVAAGGKMGAHNAGFERAVWNHYLRVHVVPHWPELRIQQQDCTMSRANTLALPPSLDGVTQVIGARATKDMEGHALMLKMMKPRKINPDGTYVWWGEPALVNRLEQYCDDDVRAETETDGILPPLSARERRLWELDQRINERGFRLDRTTMVKIIAVRAAALEHANADISRATNGAVTKTSQVKRIVDWIGAQGITISGLDKQTRDEVMLRDDVIANDAVMHVLDLRKEAGQEGPTAKYAKGIECISDRDDRARNLYMYHGASSGRWTAKQYQPHNMYRIDADRDGPEIAQTMEWLQRHSANDVATLLRVFFGSALKTLAKLTRMQLLAESGKKLVGADLSNIEGRLQAWIGREQWKLDAFRMYDIGLGPDLYCVAYGRAFNEDPAAVRKDFQKRQIGKVMELALGYQGSVGSFLNMGKNYGLKPAALVPVIKSVAGDRWAEWCDRYAKARDKRGLPQDQWAAVKTIVQGWREQHAGIVQSWWDLQDAAIEATANPGQIVHVCDGRVAYMKVGAFLWCSLPSGRVLAYSNPRVIKHYDASVVYEDGRETFEIDGYKPEDHDRWVYAARVGGDDVVQGWSWFFLYGFGPDNLPGGTLVVRERRRVDYDGWDGEKTKRWTSFSLYGGMQFNHVTQGSARDVLVDGMFRVEDAGYPIVMHTHDDVMTEPPKDFGSADDLRRLLVMPPDWLPGCPLSAKAWSGERYTP